MVLAINVLAFAFGVLALQFTSQLVDSYWLIFLPICLLCVYLRSAYSVLFIFISGFLYALLHAHSYFYYHLPNELIAKDLLLEGQISSVVTKNNSGQRFEFDVIKAPRNSTAHFPKKIRLSWYHTQNVVKAGQNWRLMVRLKPPHGFRNPNGFDYERWLYTRGIHATGYVRKAAANQYLSQNITINSWRQHLFDQIQSSARPFNAVLAALIIGDKSQISESQWQVFRRTGTSHLMAISGLHIGLVAALIFWLAQKLCPRSVLKRFSAQQFAAVLALISAIFYALLAGFSVPTQRAITMLCVLLAAIIFKRNLVFAQALSLALLAVLIIDPTALLSAGFYLSFAAVAAITYGLVGRLGHTSRGFQIIHIQWRLGLCLLPISFYWFQQASLIAPIANLILVPWVSFLVVPVALLSSLFSFWLPRVFNSLLDVADFLLSFIWPFLNMLSSFPLSSLSLAGRSWEVIMLALFGIILILAPKGFPLRWMGFIWLLPLIFNTPKTPDKGYFSLIMLDVGQGLSIVVQTHHHTMVFDSGAAFSPHFNAGDRVILPYLQQRGINNINMLLISHGDRDHIGGAQAIINKMPVWKLLGQGINKLKHPRQQACQQGQHWYWDGVLFEILHPDKVYKKRNFQSCVLKISTQNTSVLITADIEKEVERRLLREMPEKLNSDVLIVPHHGSNTSSSVQFIAATSPQIALVSAGFANRFGHPRGNVVARYVGANIPLYNTATEGAIELLFTPDKVKNLRLERRADRHYWQHTDIQ